MTWRSTSTSTPKVVPCYDKYQKVADGVGGDGLVMGTRLESPYQSWLIRMAGYETGFAHLYDHTERVERFLRFLTDWTRQTCRIMWESPAEVMLASDNLSGSITPPRFFRKYLVPFYQEFSGELHKRGKWLAVHFDGEAAPLLSAFPESGVDVAECFTPAPMTRVTLAEAQAAWGDKVIIWGGIPSIVMCPSTPDEDFESLCGRALQQGRPGGKPHPGRRGQRGGRRAPRAGDARFGTGAGAGRADPRSGRGSTCRSGHGSRIAGTPGTASRLRTASRIRYREG